MIGLYQKYWIEQHSTLLKGIIVYITFYTIQCNRSRDPLKAKILDKVEQQRHLSSKIYQNISNISICQFISEYQPNMKFDEILRIHSCTRTVTIFVRCRQTFSQNSEIEFRISQNM